MKPGRGNLLAGLLAAGLLVAGAIPASGGVAAADALRAEETEFRLVAAGAAPLQLVHGFVEPTSVRVFVDGRLWQPDVDYRLRARSGLVVPLRDWVVPAAGAEVEPALVMIRYTYLPVPVPPRRDLRPVAAAPRPGSAPAAGLFAPGADPAGFRTGQLQVSGSKTVQVASGSRRELTVDQNLRLNILGQLTPDIAVRAFLSDDNLPVVPEGNTEELRDIDKVLVELTASRWRATLGDFVARREGTAFGNYRRKLQGISLEATPGATSFEVLAGSPRGRYRTLQIRGEEANQGPYRLAGGAGGGNLFIVAGSERVVFDGEELTRGADRDYTIDYVLGTVTFTYRRLVTSESTIVVEFEEGEGAYARTVVGAGAGVAFTLPGLDTAGEFRARLIREKDDAGRLRTGELAPTDEAVLAAAGDDPARAVAGGITAVPVGEGEYVQQDQDGKTIYVFAETGGDWNVEFFYVAPGAGDYTLDRLTDTGRKVFRHVGAGLGSYLIGRPLPLPGEHTVATLSAAVGDTSGNHFSAEWNSGRLDANLLSDIDDGDDTGGAGRVAARLRDQPLAVGGRSLGELDLQAHWEKQDGRFRPFQVRKTIFAYDQWGLDDRARQPGFLLQEDREAGLDGTWRTGREGDRLEIGGRLGSLRHGEALSASQAEGRAAWQWRGGRGRHSVQSARADDDADPLAIRRALRGHEMSWGFGPVVPTVHHRLRRWRDDAAGPASSGGYRLEEYGAGLASRPGSSLGWQVGFSRGLADSLRGAAWERARDSRTTRAGVTTGRFWGMRLVGEGTLRESRRPDGPDQTTRLGRVNLSGQWAATASDWSLGYRVDNSRAEVLDRQIVFVGDGQGDFDEDGRYLGPGQGGYDTVFVGTDSLVATTGVAADMNWRQGFTFLGEDRWWGEWSSLTLAAVEGRSTTDQTGRLLSLNPQEIFSKDAAVLGDLNFSEELVFLRHKRTVDLRTKFAYRETVDRQFADHPEDRTARTWQATGSANLTRRSVLKLRWQREDDRRYTAESGLSSRRSYLLATRRWELGWNLSPSPELRWGLQAERVTRADGVSAVDQREWALRPTARARWAKAWTLQTDLRLADTRSDEPAGAVRPYFFPPPGTNVESSFRVAWDPSSYLQVAATWFTQKRGDRRWRHDVRLETTARF